MAAALPLLPPPAHAAEQERRQRRSARGKAHRCISLSCSSCPLCALPVRAAAGGSVTVQTVGRRGCVAFLVGSPHHTPAMSKASVRSPCTPIAECVAHESWKDNTPCL